MRDALDGYAPGYSHDALEMMTSRTAEGRAAFFLSWLAPGMRVLDAGCGPGTITRGLARAVMPGEAAPVSMARRPRSSSHAPTPARRTGT
jgi:SAM-dependent methyltransferase